MDYQQNNQPHDEDEIDLRDYINVILKRKWTIIAIFLVSVIVAIIVSLLITPTYQSSSLIKIGQIKKTPLENVDEIQAVLSSGKILKQIGQKMGITPEEKIGKLFDIEPVKKGKTISGEGESILIKIKGRGTTPQKAAEITNIVSNILINRHQKIFAEAKKTFDAELETIQQNKENTNKNIEQTKEDISRIEADINKYEKEINKRANIQSEGQGRIAESYIKLLDSVKNQKESKDKQLLDLEQQLINLDESIQQKKFERAYQTKETTIESPAILPKTRIAPKRKQNVLIAGVLGIFIGILWAFGAEYFSKNKE